MITSLDTIRCPRGYALVNGRCVPTQVSEQPPSPEQQAGPAQASPQMPPVQGPPSPMPGAPPDMSMGTPAAPVDPRQEAMRRLRAQYGPQTAATSMGGGMM